MTYWPEHMAVDPIGDWPGILTARRQRSPFSAALGATMETLRRELRELGAKNARLQIAVPASKFRLDGRPYADAKPLHPGLILTLDSKHGPLSYPCDTFSTWQDNLRAIALGLEALRKVDRYGVTRHGEQYRGFLAIEGATAMPAGFADAADALGFIDDLIRDAQITTNPLDLRLMLRQAKRLAHPDSGGDSATFQRVMLAEAKLRETGDM
jgi:hypothetical protein